MSSQSQTSTSSSAFTPPTLHSHPPTGLPFQIIESSALTQKEKTIAYTAIISNPNAASIHSQLAELPAQHHIGVIRYLMAQFQSTQIATTSAADRRRRSGGESSEGSASEFASTLPVSASKSRFSARFDSFLAALDAAQVTPIPFHTTLHYIPLIQQYGHSIGAPILGNQEDGTRIFIRPCYDGLWNLIQKQRNIYLERKSVDHSVFITGNSGVGKSIFFAYLIKQFRSLPKPPAMIVYDNISLNQCCVMKPGSSQVEMYKEPPTWMDSNSDVYLVDVGGKPARQPSKCWAFTIIVASPHAMGKQVLHHWSKQLQWPYVRYMPCWTKEELEVCRRVIRPSDDEAKMSDLKGDRLLDTVSSESLAKHFDQFGGTARVAFTADDKLPMLEKKLEEALFQCDLSIVSSQVGSNLDLMPETSSWLLHYDVDLQSFELKSIEFASQFILQQVWRKYSLSQTNKVLSFINATSDNEKWSGVRGNLFEPLAHEYLRKGGTFVIEQFVNPKESKTERVQSEEGSESEPQTLILPKSTSIRSVADPSAFKSLALGQYGQPSKGNFPTIDAVIKPNRLFQITVSKSHNVNIDGLINAVQGLQLKRGDRPQFFFVVPPQQFATFKVGSFVSDVGTPISALPQCDYWVMQLYSLDWQRPLDVTPTISASISASSYSNVRVSAKRKSLASSSSPPPPPKITPAYRTLPPPPTGHTIQCSCKGPCSTTACHCRRNDPRHRHKCCVNHLFDIE